MKGVAKRGGINGVTLIRHIENFIPAAQKEYEKYETLYSVTDSELRLLTLHERWSFDDEHIGTLRENGQSLKDRLITRPTWTSKAAWYELAGSICKAHNSDF